MSSLVAHSAPELWDAALGQMLLRVTRQNYDSWLRCTSGLRFDGTTLVVSVPNELTRDWLATRLRSVVRHSLTAVGGGGLKVEYDVTPVVACTSAGEWPLQPSLIPPLPTPLNPRYRFASLIPGKYNRFAATVALNVVSDEETTYSPLYITGPSGSGKTHLLHAIGHAAAERGLGFVLVTADQFLGDFTASVKERSGASFRARYRDVDLLLVDDVHTLVGKKATQQELFLTIAGLHDRGRRVVVTGDLAAANCNAAARFEGILAWGLVATIEQPDFEDRLAFIEAKAACLKAHLPLEVIQYLALRVKENLRDLEGALNRVIALGRISREPLDIDLAAKALQPVSPTPLESRPPVLPTRLIDTVCRHLDIDPAELTGLKRDRSLTHARHLAMYLLRRDAGLTYAAIAQLLRKKDHSTVVHACAQVERQMAVSPAIRAEIDAIRTALRRIDSAA